MKFISHYYRFEQGYSPNNKAGILLVLWSILPFFHNNTNRHSRPPKNINMKYATVVDVVESFPHPILPTVQVDPDYQTIHAIRKLLQANARAIDAHLGGGDLGHLGLVVSEAAYAIFTPTGENGPILWINPKGEHRQLLIRARWYNSAQPDTLGKKLFSLSVSLILYNKHLRIISSLFLSQCNCTS
jgi:hypothetical protein